MIVFLTALVGILYTGSFAQNLCITPNGENGRCILFENCTPFTTIWKHRNHKILNFIRSSHCGYQKDKPLVCCGTVAEFTDFSNNKNNPTTLPAITTPTTMSTTTPTTTTITTQEPITTMSSAVTTMPSAVPTMPPAITTDTPMTTRSDVESRVEPITSNPVSVTPSDVTVTTPQLFTSPILISTPPPTRSIPLRRTGYQEHPNFNLLPRYGKCGLHSPAERIINGNEAEIDEFPWLAMIMYRRDGQVVPNCGGSLINSKYVLTAAHCIRANMLSIRLGEHDLRTDEDCDYQEGVKICADPPQEFQIESFFIHKRYNKSDISKHHDIALIRLKGEANITGDFVKPICLPMNNERSVPYDNLTVAGWGITEKNESSPVKRTVDVTLWPNMACQVAYRIGFTVNISSSQLCAGGAVDKKDSCSGDSGGPLMRTLPGRVQYYVEGIVSFGPIECGMRGIPAIYVRVGDYIQWILDTIKP